MRELEALGWDQRKHNRDRGHGGREKDLRGFGRGVGIRQERPECFPYTGRGTYLEREAEDIWNTIEVLEESLGGQIG